MCVRVCVCVCVCLSVCVCVCVNALFLLRESCFQAIHTGVCVCVCCVCVRVCPSFPSTFG